MAILGGDDAGGGVTWAPQVIEEAQAHGLILGENGVLDDSKKGENLPDGVAPMPLLTDEDLTAFPEVPPAGVVRDYVARYWDLMALAAGQPARVIGEDAVLRDKPGFEVDLLTRGSVSADMHTPDQPTVLMPMRGQWRLVTEDGEVTLAPGDTCLINQGEAYALAPSMTGEASLYRVRGNDDPAGSTWTG